MRILLTNDDGINAPGLTALEAIAAEIAGPKGEVWTVAPAFEQSGVGHCISYIHPTMIAELGPRRFAAEGSPADCVLAGLYDVLAGSPPDLVLSGVNRGNNSAENALYSGTLGDSFEAAAQHGAGVVRKLLQNGHWDQTDYRVFYNVNFPPLPAAEVKGIRVAAQGYRRETRFGIEAQIAPNGRRFLWIKGGRQDVPTAPGTDAHANLDGYISVTPMRVDLTAHDRLDSLRAALE